MASSKAGAVAGHPGATVTNSATVLAEARSPEEREQKVYENLLKTKDLHLQKTANSNA